MRHFALLIAAALILIAGQTAALASQGVAIQRVISNTRSELGQLATSAKAQEIADLMQRFDRQYETWNQTCAGTGDFDPDGPSDTCRQMAEQMRETGIALYGKLAEYLPDVGARYAQGAKSAERVLRNSLRDQSPGSLYQNAMDGVAQVPSLGALSPGEPGSPFDLELDDFPDPSDEMFAALEKLVPDFSNEIPETVRAGNAQVSMMKKAQRARYLAAQFEKARFALESQREYGRIIFGVTQAVSALPEVLGIQYTGARLTARPNQKVLDYYRSNGQPGQTVAGGQGRQKAVTGGFAPR
jgi:hypothetical protein